MLAAIAAFRSASVLATPRITIRLSRIREGSANFSSPPENTSAPSPSPERVRKIGPAEFAFSV
jgi:hypothetical protein